MIVIHEAGGLGEHIRDVANRLAGLGYLALGVDLYTREGGPPPTGDMQALFARLFSMSDEVVLGDLQGAADFLRARGDCSGRVGCIGFCMGGRYTLLLACASDRLDAAVDCWGGFIDSATPDRALHARAPRAAAGARRAAALPAARRGRRRGPEPLARARRAAARARAGAAVARSPSMSMRDAGHAFFADYRPTYRPGPAAQLWERVVPFFARHLQQA